MRVLISVHTFYFVLTAHAWHGGGADGGGGGGGGGVVYMEYTELQGSITPTYTLTTLTHTPLLTTQLARFQLT